MKTLNKWNREMNELRGYLKDNKKEQFRLAFFQFHHQHQATLFQTLTRVERLAFYRLIKPEEFAFLFMRFPKKVQKKVSKELQHNFFVNMLRNMSTVDIAHYFRQLNNEQRYFYMAFLPKRKVRIIKCLLCYHPHTVGGVMRMEYVVFEQDATVESVLVQLEEYVQIEKTAQYIFIVTYTNKLIGVVSLNRLITSPKRQVMSSLIKKRVIAVRPYLNKKIAHEIMIKHDLLSLPVVSKDNQMLGIIKEKDIFGDRWTNRVVNYYSMLFRNFN